VVCAPMGRVTWARSGGKLGVGRRATHAHRCELRRQRQPSTPLPAKYTVHYSVDAAAAAPLPGPAGTSSTRQTWAAGPCHSFREQVAGRPSAVQQAQRLLPSKQPTPGSRLGGTRPGGQLSCKQTNGPPSHRGGSAHSWVAQRGCRGGRASQPASACSTLGTRGDGGAKQPARRAQSTAHGAQAAAPGVMLVHVPSKTHSCGASIWTVLRSSHHINRLHLLTHTHPSPCTRSVQPCCSDTSVLHISVLSWVSSRQAPPAAHARIRHAAEEARERRAGISHHKAGSLCGVERMEQCVFGMGLWCDRYETRRQSMHRALPAQVVSSWAERQPACRPCGPGTFKQQSTAMQQPSSCKPAGAEHNLRWRRRAHYPTKPACPNSNQEQSRKW
jgi:hypothetical protein